MTPAEVAAHFGQFFTVIQRGNRFVVKGHCGDYDLTISAGSKQPTLVKCTGCDTADALAKVGLRLADLSSNGEHPHRSAKLRLIDYADAKGFDPAWLRDQGVVEVEAGLQFTSYDENGAPTKHQHVRRALDNIEPRFWWLPKGGSHLFGVERLNEARQSGRLVLDEGESDALTHRRHGIPALGFPGASYAGKLTKRMLVGITEIVICQHGDVRQEPDKPTAGENFTASILARIVEMGHTGGTIRVVRFAPDAKDVNAVYLQNRDGFPATWAALISEAEVVHLDGQSNGGDPKGAETAGGEGDSTRTENSARERERAEWVKWITVVAGLFDGFKDEVEKVAKAVTKRKPEDREHLIGALREVRAAIQSHVETLADPPMIDPDQALEVAEAHISRTAIMGHRTLHRHLEDYYQWDANSFKKAEREQTRAALSHFMVDTAQSVHWQGVKFDPESPVTWVAYQTQPKPAQIGNAMQMLQDRTHVTVEPPCWIPPAQTLLPGWSGAVEALLEGAIPCRNGILLPGDRTLLKPHPGYFTLNALGADYDANAECPRWLAFLKTIWPHDQESIDCLQEIFGYMISGDTRLEKMFLLIGPPRSGKGTVASTLKGLLGNRAVATVALSKLIEGFESQIIVGRQLVIVPDARMGKKTDTAKLMDALLSISGGDNPSVARKFRDAYEGRLHARIMILTNILPHFPDDSGATANRFIILKTMLTFLGKENLTLKRDLLEELSGILNWALDGLDRLKDRGRFLQPASAADEVAMLKDTGSRVAAFIEERLTVIDPAELVGVPPGEQPAIPKAGVYTEFQNWHRAKYGDDARIMESGQFWKVLKVACPGVRDYKPHGKERLVVGITFKKAEPR